MLTALSMISMLMSIATELRLLRAPKRPIANMSAPSIRNEFRVTMVAYSSRAMMIAPTIATSSSTDAISKGST